MNILDRARIKSNPNLVDTMPYNNEKLEYAIKNGYKFNPETCDRNIGNDLFCKQFMNEIYEFTLNAYDEKKDILDLIFSLDKSYRLKLVSEKPEILSKYSSTYEPLLNEIKEEDIVNYFDLSCMKSVDERTMRIISKYPEKFIEISDRLFQKDVITIITDNLDTYFYYIDSFKDEIKKEVLPTLKKYAIENKIMINDKFPKLLLSDNDFLTNYLTVDPDYAKNLDSNIELVNIDSIADSIVKSDKVLPYPVYGIYEKYDKIKSAVILKHKEFINDYDKLFLLKNNYNDLVVFKYLKDANYKFDENTPTFLYDNRYVLRELLLNGVKFKTDVPLNVLPIEEVFELFKKNYTIDDIDKINIFKNNPLIIEWGLQNGISMEKIYDNLDISAFSKIDNKTIIIKKPSVENINKVITLLKSNPKVDVDKINIDISSDMDGEILDYTNLVYLENLKKNNLNINFSVDSDEISLDTMILNEQFLEKTAEEIKNSPLSPFEKYIAAYDIVKTLKRYKGKDEGHRSRQLYAIMGGDLMVCVGYANLLENLLSRIGIPCSKLHCVAIKDADKGYTEGHARNYVYIKDPKYNIDGYSQCDTTWEECRRNLYDHLLIRTNYAYTKDLISDNADAAKDKIKELSEGKVDIPEILKFLRKIDPVLCEEYKNKKISDEEFISMASNKINKKVDLETILSAIRNVKKYIFKDENAADYFIRDVCKNISENDFCTKEEADRCHKEVKTFRKENSLNEEHMTYADAFNSKVYENLEEYIDKLKQELLKNYSRCEYDYDSKCILVGVKKSDIQLIDFLNDKGQIVDSNEEYVMFSVPFELEPDLTIKEQAASVAGYVDVNKKTTSKVRKKGFVKLSILVLMVTLISLEIIALVFLLTR